MLLYKYVHPDRIDILQNFQLRFSSPAALNDPFEMKPSISALASSNEIIKQFHKNLPELLSEEYSKLSPEMRAVLTPELFAAVIPQFIPEAEAMMLGMAGSVVPVLQQTIETKLEEFIGMLCLTESTESLLMWAHYADSHRGFLIEFDSNSPFFNQRVGPNDELRHLRKVVYQNKRPSLVLWEMEGLDALLTKGMEWSYESEWRMLMPLSQASTIIGEGPLAIHLFNVPPQAITGVIFGCRASNSLKREISTLVKFTANHRHISLQESRISQSEYKILFNDYQA